MAGSASSRASLTADLGRLGPGIESQLPGAASYSHCRPLVVARERPVSRRLMQARTAIAERLGRAKQVVKHLLTAAPVHAPEPIQLKSAILSSSLADLATTVAAA
jgi:hypothetical protein